MIAKTVSMNSTLYQKRNNILGKGFKGFSRRRLGEENNKQKE